MGLRIWNSLTDPYSHTQLGENLTRIDLHDHTPGKGTLITTEAVADGSITQSKLDPSVALIIPDGAVTNSKLASDSVTTDKLVAGSVTSAQILDEGITTNDIGNSQVTNNKLAGGITDDKLASSELGRWKPLLHAGGSFSSAAINRYYLLREAGSMVAASTPSPSIPVGLRLNGSDLAIPGKTVRLRLASWLSSNQNSVVISTSAPQLGVTFAPLDALPQGSGSTSTGPAWFAPTPPAGWTATWGFPGMIANIPSVNIGNYAVGPPVTFPTSGTGDGNYGFYVTLLNTPLTDWYISPVVVFNVILQYSYV